MRRITFAVALVAVALLAVRDPASAGPGAEPGEQQAKPAEAEAKQDDPKAKPKGDVVRQGDLLVVNVPTLLGGGAEYVKPVRVHTDGKVPLPALRESLKVEGLTLAEVEDAVNDRLRKAGLLEHPETWLDRMERGDAPTVKPDPIAPGDVLRVSLTGIAGPGVEQVRTLHVCGEGNIGLPYRGQTKVAGLSEADAEAAITKGYEDEGIIRPGDWFIAVLRIKLPPGPEPIPQSEPIFPQGRDKRR